MTQSIRHNELAEIVAGLLTNPELMGHLDSADQHKDFIRDIANVVADHCGGDIVEVTEGDHAGEYHVDVDANDSLPSLRGNIWSAYDQESWDALTEEGTGIVQGEAIAPHELKYRRLLVALDILQYETDDLTETDPGRYLLQNAAEKIDGYYGITNTGLEAFIAAKTEAVAAYQMMMVGISALSFHDFLRFTRRAPPAPVKREAAE